MTRRQNRMILVGLLVSGVFLAGYLGLKAFSENLLYFYTPSDIAEGKAPTNKSFRVGGLVEIDSLVREGMQVTFMVTDNIKSIKVIYEGILPDLFREGQGVVASIFLYALLVAIKARTEVLVREQNSRWVKDEVEGVVS